MLQASTLFSRGRCPAPAPRGVLILGLMVALVLPMVAVAGHHNPAAEGFNLAGSDAVAIAVADKAMEAMGGREAWDQTRYLSWNFFGMRTHLWDKWTGNLRFEQGDLLVLMNVHSREGLAYRGGEELAGENRAKALTSGYKAWINDSYWLLMPYKLKDSGVTLRYVGEQNMEDGRLADVLQLTFADVGVTPENKYHVFAAKDTGLIEQWSFFRSASDEEPGFTTPWAKWSKIGSIMLSGDRGQRQVSEIAVYEDVPAAAFSRPDELDRSSWR